MNKIGTVSPVMRRLWKQDGLCGRCGGDLKRTSEVRGGLVPVTITRCVKCGGVEKVSA